MFPSIRHLAVLGFGLIASVFTLLVVTAPSTATQVTVTEAAVSSLAVSDTPTPAVTTTASQPAVSPSRSPSASPSPSTTPTPSPSPSTTSPAGPTAGGSTSATINCNGNPAVTAKLRSALTAKAQSNVSVVVHDFASGSYCGYRDSRPFITASIVKVATVASLMRQRQDQGRSLTATEKRWARSAITISDNGAQDRVWDAQGGTSGMRKFLVKAGMSQSSVASGGQWGLTQTTARDQVILLDAITHGSLLNSGNRAELVALMKAVSSDQRWGVPTYAASPKSVAVKNGWLSYGGSWRVNSIGWVKYGDDDYTMAVLSSGSSTFNGGITKVSTGARAVHRVL